MTMTNRGRVAFALLLILAAPSLLLAPQGAAAASPVFTIESSADGEWLVVRVHATQQASVHFVLSHADPLLGTVVDRVAPLDIAANHTAEVSMRDVRPGVTFTARLFDGATPLPRRADAAYLYDGAALDARAELARATVGPLPAASAAYTDRVGATRVASDGGNYPQLATTAGGNVLYTYLRASDNVLHARVSRDGGLTFGAAFPLVATGTLDIRWTAVEASSGKMLVLVTWPFVATPSRLLRVDLALDRVDLDAAIAFPDAAGMRPSTYQWSASRLPSGAIVVATMGGHDTREPGEYTEYRGYDMPLLWTLSENGTLTYLAAAPDTDSYAWSPRIGVSPGGVLGLAWTNGTDEWVATSRSSDGGRTWSAPTTTTRAQMGVDELNGPLAVVAMDDGAVLASLEAFGPNEPHAPESAYGVSAILVRSPPLGAATVTRLHQLVPAGVLGPGEGSNIPQLASQGRRVWAAWGGSPAWVAESTDGGASFGVPVSMDWRIAGEDVQYVSALASYHSVLGILPDGRPIVLGGNPSDSVASLFQPSPRAGDDLTRVRSIPPPPPPQPAQPALVAAWASSAVFAAPGASVEALLHVRNGGDGALGGGSFYIENTPLTPYLTPTSSVDLAPGEQKTYSFRFDVPAEEAPRSGTLRVSVRQGTVELAGASLDYYFQPVVFTPPGSPVTVRRNETTRIAIDVDNRGDLALAAMRVSLDGLPASVQVSPARAVDVSLPARVAQRLQFDLSLAADAPASNATATATLAAAWQAQTVSRPASFEVRIQGAYPPTTPPAGGNATGSGVAANATVGGGAATNATSGGASGNATTSGSAATDAGAETNGTASSNATAATDATARSNATADAGATAGADELPDDEPLRPLALVPETTRLYFDAAANTTLRLTVRHEGRVALDAVTFTVDGAPVGVRQPTEALARIAGGAERVVELTLAAGSSLATLGGDNGTLRVQAHAGGRDVSEPVEVGWSLAPIDFLDSRPSIVRLSPGERVVANLTLANRGAGFIDGATLRVTGLPAGVYIENPPRIDLEPGQVATIGVVFVTDADATQPESLEVTAARVQVHADGQVLGHYELSFLQTPAPAPPTNVETKAAVGADSPLGVVRVAVWFTAGGALVALGAAAARRTDVGMWAAGAAAAPLYTRLKRSDVLHHEVRAGILAHVQQNPGVRYERLRQDLGLPNGVLSFHLQVLEREGFLASRVEWTRRQYYATGAAPPARGASSAHEQMASLLAAEPGLSPSQVADRMGVSRQLARYHLRSLERQGVARAEGRGASLAYYLARR